MLQKNFKIAVSAAISLLLSGAIYAAPFQPVTSLSSGEPVSVNPKPSVKVGNPYEIKGVKYTPKEQENYDVIGIASWYGDDFQGKLTANGEVFDMEELTAAHNTLSLPSIVEVTNLDNGKKIIVRVNDRGPFSGGRTIDLSKRAAELLGFKDSGTAKVRVTLLKEVTDQVKGAIQKASATNNNIRNNKSAPVSALDNQALSNTDSDPQVEPALEEQPSNIDPQNNITVASNNFDQNSSNSLNKEKDIVLLGNDQSIKPISLAEPKSVKSYLPRGVFVQIGAFSNSNEKIKKDVDSLSDIGVVSLQKVDIEGRDILRLRVGPYGSVDDALKIKNKLVKLGYKDSRVVVEQ